MPEYPAEFLGLSDKMGMLQVGGRADMVLLDNKYRVEQTYIGGELVFQG
ncbi:amidohydrolase family protein, partial [Shewanella sp. MBTL60-112-B1]